MEQHKQAHPGSQAEAEARQPAQKEGEKLANELEQIRDKRSRDRRPGFFSKRRSKIARYHAEVLQLQKLGASLEDIRLWLQRRRMKVQRSTIHRYLKREGVC